MKKKRKVGILLHIPHAGLVVPWFSRRKFLLSKKELQHEIEYSADRFSDELFLNENCNFLLSKYSRLFCDMERFRSDDDEYMSKVGRGAVYAKTFGGKDLLHATHSYKSRVLKKYYDVYHKKLNRLTKKIIREHGYCLILDCHTFSESFFEKSDENFPDICIGVEKGFNNKKILSLVTDYFNQLNYSVAINFPYSQSMVPSDYLNTDSAPLVSIMIEVNKKIYMNEKVFEKSENFNTLCLQIKELINLLITHLNNSK